MENRGRESKSEREVSNVVSIADVRPEPPAPLSVEEAEEWKLVVNSMHPGWYRKEYQGVLVAYCRQVVLGNYFHGLASSYPTELRETDTGMKQYLDLTKAAERADRAADGPTGHRVLIWSCPLRQDPASRCHRTGSPWSRARREASGPRSLDVSPRTGFG